MGFTDIINCFVKIVLDSPEKDLGELFNSMLATMPERYRKKIRGVEMVILKTGETVRAAPKEIKDEIYISLGR